MKKIDFFRAVRRNDIESVKKYLVIGDPSVEDNFAIRQASRNGYTKMVELLLSDDRVDPYEYVNGKNAVDEASENGHTEVIKLLLADSRVHPTPEEEGEFNRYAILLAYSKGHLDTVRLLISDPRVSFRFIPYNLKEPLLNEERKKLQKQIISGYKSIEQSSPQVIFGDKSKFKQKSQIPKSLIKKIVYQAPYEELCSIIHGKFPSAKLLALADLLKIEYDLNTTYKEICGKVKLVLLNLF